MALSSENREIDRKLASSGWPKMVESITINSLHSLKGIIEFKWPVVAIVGENGTGKSTILKVLACAYKAGDIETTFYPSDFFPDTAWEKISAVELTYQYRLGQTSITHSVRKPTERWRGMIGRPTNKVFWFDLDRTQPIESSIGYSKLAKRLIQETTSRSLSEQSTNSISYIMGRPYTTVRYAKTDVDKEKEVGILGFPFGDISEFHQGTGESTISELIAAFENVPDYSLVIIDEIESSLHPRAQRRLLRDLMKIARKKTLQVVFSTHSPYVLNELPEKARVLLAKGANSTEVIYAPSTQLCLSAIDDDLHPDLDILVEDFESKVVLSEIIRYFIPEIVNRVRIIETGPANAVEQVSKLSKEGKIPYHILGVVDGDQKMPNCESLPMVQAPEKQIISDISEQHIKELSVVTNLDQDYIRSELQSAMTLADHHEWVKYLSVKFNINSGILWGNFVSIWVKNCLSEKQATPLKEKLLSAL